MLCGVRKEVIFKYANDFEFCFMIVWAINVNDVNYEGWKRLVEEYRRIG